MRIIAGEHKGRRIDAPDGKGTRPTVDRVRESIMSAVYSARGGFEGERVLDVFSGSGAMGLEAMSRGAEFALLNDSRKDALACINSNISSLGYGSSQVATSSVDACSGSPTFEGGPYSLAFLDPPYAMDQQKVLELTSSLFANAILSHDAFIVYEHDEPIDEALAEGFGLSVRNERKMGKTYVTYLELA